jgi:hypothetical protein
MDARAIEDIFIYMNPNGSWQTIIDQDATIANARALNSRFRIGLGYLRNSLF